MRAKAVCSFSAPLLRLRPNYCTEEVACPLNTASIAAWAHFSPSPLDTPIAPMTWPLTTIGTAPGCGKSCMKVGAKFSPLRTILLVSAVGGRQGGADLAFNSGGSLASIVSTAMAQGLMMLALPDTKSIDAVFFFDAAQ